MRKFLFWMTARLAFGLLSVTPAYAAQTSRRPAEPPNAVVVHAKATTVKLEAGHLSLVSDPREIAIMSRAAAIQ